MSKRAIEKVGVLGAGIMGSGIACHLANAGLEVVLLDIPPPDGKGGKNALAEGAIARALKAKGPRPLFHESRAALIRCGNLEDDLSLLSGCGLVIEAVKEDLEIKRRLYERLESVLTTETIISSNTSGLPLEGLVAGRSAGFRQRFLITHFFNPPRYMRLLEIITGKDTSPEVAATVTAFAQDLLGKGVVFAKDTPNFIANRIGTYGIMRALKEMEKQAASIEEIDAIFGPPLGRPKTAVFRTGDLVGIDLLVSVIDHCYQGLPKDPEREVFRAPEWVLDLVRSGKHGQKTGEGFYRKAAKAPDNPKGIEVWDPAKKIYRTPQRIRIDSLGVAKNLEDPGARLNAVVFSTDRAGRIAWPVLRDSLAYAMNIAFEIADDLESIDRAMCWGFSWELGPFETWDALGFERVAARMFADGIRLAPWVEAFRKEGRTSIHGPLAFVPKVDPRRRDLAAIKASGQKPRKSNSGASLHDVGDGVFALEFHTKGNAIDADVITMLDTALDEAEDQGKGLVIYNEGANFSFGANLMLIYMLASQKEWGQIERASGELQRVVQRIRYSRVPVVAAPHGMALGGGCEICLAAGSAAGVRPHAELYIGLVEVGVGLIPGAGGTVNTLFGMLERIPDGAKVDPLILVGQAFQQIALAKVSSSAEEARFLGYLPQKVQITMDRKRLLEDARQTVLHLSEAGYRPPLRRAFRLPGESGIATLSTMVRGMVQSGVASEHDGLIALKLAHVLCGGKAGHTRPVGEDELFALEREAFVSLCGEPKTVARIEQMLTTNKPLRN